jgi:hypothetical protein
LAAFGHDPRLAGFGRDHARELSRRRFFPRGFRWPLLLVLIRIHEKKTGVIIAATCAAGNFRDAEGNFFQKKILRAKNWNA